MTHHRALRTGGLILENIFARAHFKQAYEHPRHSFSLKPPPAPPPRGSASAKPQNAAPTDPPRKPVPPPRKFPELLYFPKFFRWLGMKVKLKYLRHAWDPEFSEGAFIYGSTQAICRISQIVHRDKPNELKSLLTEQAEKQLRADMLGKLTSLQKKVILLTPEDIKLLVPIKVQLVKNKPDRKQCLVMLKSLSMKWYQDNQNVKLVLIVIDTEFTREYTANNKSEWFVSLFKIVQCALINGSPAPPKTA